jgi:hypothetical protein
MEMGDLCYLVPVLWAPNIRGEIPFSRQARQNSDQYSLLVVDRESLVHTDTDE